MPRSGGERFSGTVQQTDPDSAPTFDCVLGRMVERLSAEAGYVEIARTRFTFCPADSA